MPPQFPPHPVVTEYLNLADAVTAEFDHYIHLLSTLTTTASDDTNTVAVTIDPNGAITDIWIKPGAKHLGAETINKRLNQALNKATTTVTDAKAAIDADHDHEMAAFRTRNNYLSTLIDAGPLASPPPEPPPTTAPIPTNQPTNPDRW